MNHTLTTAAASLRPYALRAAAAAWAPVSTRWLSLMQDFQKLQDGEKTDSALEQLAARVGLDEFAADVLPALKILAESLQMVSESGAIQSWTSSDWLLGLTVLAQHNTTQRTKTGRSRPPRLADPALPVQRDELTELLRFVRISDAVYADTVDQFCEEANLPRETIVRSFDGGVLAPKFVLLRNDATSEIVLAVRGTASLLDFCTDICLTNEPFADGQGHRGMVHAARWLVKNVRGDLETLTSENPTYKLVVTGHSLGAGVSALATMELKPLFPSLRCIAFATPASVTEPLAKACADYVTTVVNGDDCVPRFHQHSMSRLQSEVSAFDWRTTLKQMVDDEIEEQKSLVRQKRDRHLSEINDAFQSIKRAQEAQAKRKLTQAMQTPMGRRVSASFELTKAAFWTDEEPMDRFANVKEIVQRQKHAGHDAQWWESVEATVTGLESLAGAITRRQELQAILTKSKLLLASTGISGGDDKDEDEHRAPAQVVEAFEGGVQTEEKKKEEASSATDDFELFRSRIKTVMNQMTKTLQSDVNESISGVSDIAHVFKHDVNNAMHEHTTEVRDTADVIVRKTVRDTEDQVATTLFNDLEVDRQLTAENEEAELKTTGCETETPADGTEELLEPLFPPGRILYLDKFATEPPADENNDGVELLHVANDEFSRVVLSNRMILDHLCTTYERVLQATAAAMERDGGEEKK